MSIYVMFFLSGAAALIYQVTWVRLLTLIFDGSHLAVWNGMEDRNGGPSVGSFGKK